MDGRPASFGKRGYLIDPHRQLVVEGFRQSTDAVAAFRFGPVRESYAQQKYGDTRNVGVIGIAIFNERGNESLDGPRGRETTESRPVPGPLCDATLSPPIVANMARRPVCCAIFPSANAEILHQDLRLPDE